MRRILQLLPLLIFFPSCKAQVSSSDKKVINDLTSKKLKGEIKSLTENRYNIVEKFGESSKRVLQEKTVNKYNTNGREIQELVYEGSSDPTYRVITKYDAKGNKIEQSDYAYEESNKVNYKYDSKGNLIEEASVNGYKYVYKYNDLNKLITKSKYNKSINGFKFGGKDIFKYDGQGNKIEWVNDNENGSWIFKTIYKYDNNNNLVEEEYFTPNGRPDYKAFNKYDDKGNLIEWKHYNSKGELDRFYNCKYNQEGTLIEMNKNNGLEYYKYDNGGNEIEYSTGSDKTTYKYEFDKIGNWIKKTGYQANKPTTIFERIIEYY